MMNRKDFFEYVKDNVKDYLPEKYADANASYADAMTASAKKLLEAQEIDDHVETDDTINTNEMKKAKTTTVFREERKYNEAV